MVQGALIRLLAGRRGWSLRELARRAGVPYPTVRHVASRKESSPYAVTVLALADALGVEMNVLMGKAPVPDEDAHEQLEDAARVAAVVAELEARGDAESLRKADLIRPHAMALATDPDTWRRSLEDVRRTVAARERREHARSETTLQTPARGDQSLR